jgi:hypothetical protein
MKNSMFITISTSELIIILCSLEREMLGRICKGKGKGKAVPLQTWTGP